MENLILWVLSAIIGVGVPAAMIGTGKKILSDMPPIGAWYGFKSKYSLINNESWEFANNNMAKLWINIGETLTPAAAIAMIFCFGKDKNTILSYFGLILLVDVISMLYSRFYVSKLLKEKYDTPK